MNQLCGLLNYLLKNRKTNRFIAVIQFLSKTIYLFENIKLYFKCDALNQR